MNARHTRTRIGIATLTAGTFVLAVGCGLAGCGPKPNGSVFVDTNTATASADGYDIASWERTLRENVRDGLVDYEHLAESRQPLDAYLASAARIGPMSRPELFSDNFAKVCYFVNVHNACVLKAVLDRNIPETMHDVRMPNLATDYTFTIDGRRAPLVSLREAAREFARGDARIEFWFCEAAMGSPPLGAAPLVAQDFENQMAIRAEEMMEDGKQVEIDHDRQQLLVGLPIWTERTAFMDQYRREYKTHSVTLLNCLLDMASAKRRQQIARATGYEIRQLPFDRHLNDWTGSRTETGDGAGGGR